MSVSTNSDDTLASFRRLFLVQFQAPVSGTRNWSVCDTFLVPDIGAGYSMFNIVLETSWKAELMASLSRR